MKKVEKAVKVRNSDCCLSSHAPFLPRHPLWRAHWANSAIGLGALSLTTHYRGSHVLLPTAVQFLVPCCFLTFETATTDTNHRRSRLRPSRRQRRRLRRLNRPITCPRFLRICLSTGSSLTGLLLFVSDFFYLAVIGIRFLS